jgi:capsular polysaccharide biosynthesis protein
MVVMTALLVAAAWFLTSRQTPIYEASTLIRVLQEIKDPSETGGALATGERLARTYANIVETNNVADRIVNDLDGQVAIEDVRISAEPVEDLELLWIAARNEDPERAALIANSAPNALESFIRQSEAVADEVIVVEAAGVPSTPVAPRLILNLALAFLLGLILNGALALLIEVLGDRIHDADEVERVTGQPVLGSVPTLQFIRPHELEVPDATTPPLPRLERMESG